MPRFFYNQRGEKNQPEVKHIFSPFSEFPYETNCERRQEHRCQNNPEK
jgi:hypothetical protein